jgi:hypothetical protein
MKRSNKRVVCKVNDSTNLTYDKEYKVLIDNPVEEVYLIKDDTGNKSVEPYCEFNKISLLTKN